MHPDVTLWNGKTPKHDSAVELSTYSRPTDHVWVYMTDPERNQLLDGVSSSSAFGAQAMHFSTVSELSPKTRVN